LGFGDGFRKMMVYFLVITLGGFCWICDERDGKIVTSTKVIVYECRDTDRLMVKM
jgi:hypothetical protein